MWGIANMATVRIAVRQFDITLSCLPSVSINRVPKPCLSGARTVGPFFSVHLRCKRCAGIKRPSDVNAGGRQRTCRTSSYWCIVRWASSRPHRGDPGMMQDYRCFRGYHRRPQPPRQLLPNPPPPRTSRTTSSSSIAPRVALRIARITPLPRWISK